MVLLFFPVSAFCAEAGWINIPVQAVVVADDDGGREAATTPAEVEDQLKFANKVFALAKINFFMASGDNPSRIDSTLLNNMMGDKDAYWNDEVAEGNRIAARYPGKMLVFFRHGAGASPTGGGFSWNSYNFVTMPQYRITNHCGHLHDDGLAHEIGHYLGLSHTFAGDPYTSEKDADMAFRRSGDNMNIFDGDGLVDTPPDPAIRDLECKSDTTEIYLDGRMVELPRYNIMSYYDERVLLSPSQISIVRETAADRGF